MVVVVVVVVGAVASSEVMDCHYVYDEDGDDLLS